MLNRLRLYLAKIRLDLLLFVCSKHVQFLLLIALTLASVWIYLNEHKRLRDAYEGDAIPIYMESLRLFRIGQDKESGNLRILYRSLPLPDHDEYTSPTPMDAGKQVPVQGILERFKGALSQLNVLLRSHSRRLFASPDETSVRQNIRIFLRDWFEDSEIATESSEDSEYASQRAWIILTPEDRSAIEGYLRFGYIDSVADILISKKAHYLRSPNETNGIPVKKTVLDHWAQEVTSQISDLSANQVNQRSLTPEERESIQKQVLAWKRELNSEILKVFQDLCKDTRESTTKDCQSTVDHIVETDTSDIDSINPVNLLNELLVCSLLNLSFKETGHFWLVGKFKWLEIIYWTIFGVMTQALVQQGLFLVGAKGRRIWNPSENLRVLAKLIYAPLLSVALFLGIGYLGETTELAEFANASLTPLMVSFILGMYPNTVYRIMKRITQSLFSQEVTSTPQKPLHPAKTKVKLEQQPKTIQDLSASLKETLKAPLSQYAKDE